MNRSLAQRQEKSLLDDQKTLRKLDLSNADEPAIVFVARAPEA